jgi:hypothetical protein
MLVGNEGQSTRLYCHDNWTIQSGLYLQKADGNNERGARKLSSLATRKWL